MVNIRSLGRNVFLAFMTMSHFELRINEIENSMDRKGGKGVALIRREVAEEKGRR